jgi:hypothetical protein
MVNFEDRFLFDLDSFLLGFKLQKKEKTFYRKSIKNISEFLQDRASLQCGRFNSLEGVRTVWSLENLVGGVSV